jgi:hypothetical protein
MGPRIFAQPQQPTRQAVHSQSAHGGAPVASQVQQKPQTPPPVVDARKPGLFERLTGKSGS